MPALHEALAEARSNGRTIVVPYLMVDRVRTARLRATVEALRDAGATAVELGFPFSDPIADGPVLEAAHGVALAHRTGWKDLLESCRIASAVLPTAVMTYANPVWQEGLRAGFAQLRGAGATGVLLPDLSFEESRAFRDAARSSDLSLVLFASPGTGTARVRAIARASRGFLYLVSRYGTTGTSPGGSNVDLRAIVRTAHRATPKLPVVVGFGVHDRRSAAAALASGADGIIVGTALELLLRRGAAPSTLERWLARLSRFSAQSPTGRR